MNSISKFFCPFKGQQQLKKLPFYRFFLIVGCLLALACSFNVRASDNCEIKIFTRNSRVNLNEIKMFFNTVDVVVTRILPPIAKKSRKRPALYTIVLMNKKDFKKINIINEKNNGIRFYLPENTILWAKNDKIIARLVSAILLKKCAFPPDINTKRLPPWLVYGILAKVKRRLDKANIPGIRTFPGIHMLLTTEPPPDLVKIASSPVTPEDGPTYEIFLEASEILLASVRRLPKNREAIKDLIELSMKGVPSKESFLQIFAKKVHIMLQNTTEISKLSKNMQSGDELKTWLNENAVLMSVNAFLPGNASFAEKQFRKIEIVRYTSIPNETEKTKEERYCKVENLPEKKDEIENFTAVIKHKEIEFTRLEFAVPSSMQRSIYKIKKALQKLRTDSSFNFKDTYLQAKQSFFDELEKQNEIEAYLRKMELRFVPESWRYRTELKEINKWEQRTQQRWPALNKYLDSIDR